MLFWTEIPFDGGGVLPGGGLLLLGPVDEPPPPPPHAESDANASATNTPFMIDRLLAQLYSGEGTDALRGQQGFW